MPVKVTLLMSASLTGDRRYSFTESYWLAGRSALDGSADTACVNLASARMGIVASNIDLVSVRQSLFTLRADGKPIAARARNRIMTPGVQLQSGRTTGVSILGNTKGFPNTFCINPKESLLSFLDGQIQPAGALSSRNLYTAGLPDDIMTTGPNPAPYWAGVAGSQNSYLSFLTALSFNQFSFLGTQQPPTVGPLQIIRWANESSGAFRLMFTIGSNPAGFIAGTIIHIRGVRMATARAPTPNGKWRIDAFAGPDASGNYTYTLANTQGFASGSIITPGTVESVGYAFYQYLGTGTPQRGTARKRGGRSGAAVGKSRPRPRALV